MPVGVTPFRVFLDLFAGPGGWDLAARELGVDPLGIEWDDAACATREAAGLRTLQADVSALDPHAVMREHFAGAALTGLIASPPCQAFSMAGNGAGRRALSAYLAAIGWMGAGKPVPRDYLDEQCEDQRAHLVLEPLRWALALRPRWIALEQVEPVLPLWEAVAMALRAKGYQTWTGVLSAECFGVPQTRRRAILLASLDGPVAAPPPTHQRYIAPRRRDEATLGLFAAPEPERIVAPEDRDLLPWVSMAEALGMVDGPLPAPAPTVTSGGGQTGGVEVFASARDAMSDRRRGDWSPEDEVGFPRRADTDSNRAGAHVREIDGVEYRERDLRAASEPAFALTEKTRSWVRFRANNRTNATVRDADEPAPTLHFGHALNEVGWVVETNNFSAKRRDPDGGRSKAGSEPFTRSVDEPSPTVTQATDRWKVLPTHLDRRQTGGDGSPVGPRSVDAPAPTLQAQGLAKGRDVWVYDRPSATVNGDPRIAEPGRHDHDESGSQYGPATVRVTIEEAAVLQSFPPDYPWQGTKTKQFEQVGNAMPPLLAWHTLRVVAAPAGSGREAADELKIAAEHNRKAA